MFHKKTNIFNVFVFVKNSSNSRDFYKMKLFLTDSGRTNERENQVYKSPDGQATDVQKYAFFVLNTMLRPV